MGTYLTPSNSSVLNTTTAPITSQAFAGEDIKAGDIVTQGTDGLLYWANDPNSSLAALRPLNQATVSNLQSLYNVTIDPSVNSAGLDQDSASSVMLNDGGFAFLWRSNSVYFSIYNRDLTPRVSKTFLSGNASSISISAVQMLKLQNGNLLFIYNGPTVNYTIYTPTGSLVKSETVLDNTSTNGCFNAAILQNGNIVISYTVSNGKLTNFAIIDQSGNIVKAPSQFSTYTFLNGKTVSVSILNDGNFVIALNNGTFQRFSSTGALLGSLVTYSNTTTNESSHVTVSGLVNGNFAILLDTANRVHIYNNSGVVITTYTLSNAFSNTQNTGNSYSSLVAAPDGGFFVAWVYVNGSNFLSVSKLTAAGGLVFNNLTNIATGGGGNDGLAVRVTSSPNSQAAVSLSIGTIALFDASAVLVLSKPLDRAVSPATTSAQVYFTNDTVNTNLTNLIVLGAPSGPGPLFFLNYITTSPIRILAGVATADSSKNTLVSFMVVGNTTTRLVFTRPVAVDYTSNSGQKLSLVGNTAILKGIQQ